MKKLLTILSVLYVFAAHAQTFTNAQVPMNVDSFYQLNNVAYSCQLLIDGNLNNDAASPTGNANFKPSNATMILVPPKDKHTIVYMFPDAQHVTVRKIRIYDWSGDNNAVVQGHPDTTKFYVKRKSDGQEIYVGYYVGSNYNQWDSITIPSAGATTGAVSVYGGAAFECSRLIVRGGNAIGNTDVYGSEWQVWGDYSTYSSSNSFTVTYSPFSQLCGLNGYPYYSDNATFNAFYGLTNWRAFMDWERIEPVKDSFWFNTWNWDQQLRLQHAMGFYNLVILQHVPNYIKATYSTPGVDNTITPVDDSTKAYDNWRSYKQKARAVWQIIRRYGSNATTPTAQFRPYNANAIHNYWSNDTAKSGLNLIDAFEYDNELDRTWKMRIGYSSAREAMAQSKALYDSAKAADPAIKCVMAAIANPTKDYFLGMWDYAVDSLAGIMPFDVLNIHFYCNDGGASQTGGSRGVSPEAAGLAQTLDNYTYFRDHYAAGKPIWLTETGYDINQGSPQKAIAISPKSVEQVRADWSLRTILICWWKGVERVFTYQGYDDNPGSTNRHATDGMFDNSSQGGPARRGMTDFIVQAKNFMGGYLYDSTLSSATNYVFRGQLQSDNTKKMYVLWSGTEGVVAAMYHFNFPIGTKINVYNPVIGQSVMAPTSYTIGSAGYDAVISETPSFIEVVTNGVAQDNSRLKGIRFRKHLYHN